MIAGWMIFAVAVGVALTLAALATEHASRMLGRPGRFAWAAAIAATVVWPAIAFFVQARAHPAVSGPPAPLLPFAIDVTRMVPATAPATGSTLGALNAVLLTGWALASCLLCARFVLAVRRVARRRATWTCQTVEGEPVRVSPDLGPAVVGVLRPEIVLPEWTLSLDGAFRTLMLRHEAEHRDAGDPRLLFAAALGLVVAPWNPALWHQVRRLRLALEMDCDARVLRRHTDHDRYGRLLITIAQQQSNLPAALAASLAEPVTHLERRIRAMLSVPKRFARVRAGSLVLIAAAAIVAACAVHPPDRITAPEQSPARRAEMAANSNQTYFSYQVDRQAALKEGGEVHYPDLLRAAKVTGEVVAQFVVDTDGRADMSTFKVLKSSHDLFTKAVRQSVATGLYTPADIQGHPVKQVLQQPFVFRLSDVPEAKALPARPASSAPARATPTPAPGAAQYFTFKVDSSAHLLPGNRLPQYPAMLASAQVEGEVVAQLVVDATGHVEPSSLRVLTASHALFAARVKEAAPEWTFAPAVVDGHPVRQLVQLRVLFSLKPSPKLPPGAIEVTPAAR